MSRKPKKELASPTKKPVGAEVPANPAKGPKTATQMELEAAYQELVKIFFQKERNPWIHAIAIGLLQEGPGVIRVQEQSGFQQKQQKPEPVFFLDRFAPKCAVEEIDRHVGKFVPSFLRLSTSRFVGLASPGDSISPQDPSEYNVPPFSAGTLGAVVRVSGEQYLLGSNHAAAYNGRVQNPGDIVTPGLLDDVMGGSKIGSSSYFVPLDHSTSNSVDCALSQVGSVFPIQNMTSVKPVSFGTSVGNNALLKASPIKKFGRTTQSTTSTLDIYSWQGSIDLSFGTFDFDDMLAAYTQHNVFAAPGDSGALAFVDDRAAAPRQGVGLITARAYSFDPLNQQFVSYIIVMCRLDNVADTLASAINNANNGTTSFKGDDLEFYLDPNRV